MLWLYEAGWQRATFYPNCQNVGTCWHVISRPLFSRYSHRKGIASSAYSSRAKGFYNLPTLIIHAASLRQAFAHCGIFLAAASRRSLGRISVPMCPIALSGRIPVKALVGFYPANKLMGRRPIFRRSRSSFPRRLRRSPSLFGITQYFYWLSPTKRYVTNVLLTSPPLSTVASYCFSFDLHA